MKEVIFEKKFTLRELDDASERVIKNLVTQLKMNGASDSDIIGLLKAQSSIQVGIMEELFGAKEVKAMLKEKVDAKKKAMGSDKWKKLEEQAKKEFERN